MRKIAAAIVLAVLAGAALTAPAYAHSFNVSASTTTFWDSLRMTTDPGVTITWLGSSNQTQVFHFFNNQIVAKPSNNNWDPLSYSKQFEGITTSGEATANSLSAGIIWSDPPSGTDWIVVERGGNFQVTGSGTVTFAIDYSLAANRLIDASSLPYPFIGTSGVLEANLLLYIPFVIGLANDQHFIFLPDVRGSVNDSVSQSGTATVQYQLSDGGTYWLRAGAQSFLTVAVSEPPTLLLLMASFGVVGVLFSARFLRDRYAARLSEHP